MYKLDYIVELINRYEDNIEEYGTVDGGSIWIENYDSVKELNNKNVIDKLFRNLEQYYVEKDGYVQDAIIRCEVFDEDENLIDDLAGTASIGCFME